MTIPKSIGCAPVLVTWMCEYGFRSTKLGCLNSNFGDSCYLFGNHHINPTRYDRSIRIHHMLEWPSLLWLDLIMAKVHFDALTSPQLLTQISAILGHIHHLTICHPCWVTPCGWGWRIEKMRGVEQQQELLVACILYIACISTCVYIYITCVCVYRDSLCQWKNAIPVFVSWFS